MHGCRTWAEHRVAPNGLRTRQSTGWNCRHEELLHWGRDPQSLQFNVQRSTSGEFDQAQQSTQILICWIRMRLLDVDQVYASQLVSSMLGRILRVSFLHWGCFSKTHQHPDKVNHYVLQLHDTGVYTGHVKCQAREKSISTVMLEDYCTTQSSWSKKKDTVTRCWTRTSTPHI